MKSSITKKYNWISCRLPWFAVLLNKCTNYKYVKYVQQLDPKLWPWIKIFFLRTRDTRPESSSLRSLDSCRRKLNSTILRRFTVGILQKYYANARCFKKGEYWLWIKYIFATTWINLPPAHSIEKSFSQSKRHYVLVFCYFILSNHHLFEEEIYF